MITRRKNNVCPQGYQMTNGVCRESGGYGRNTGRKSGPVSSRRIGDFVQLSPFNGTRWKWTGQGPAPTFVWIECMGNNPGGGFTADCQPYSAEGVGDAHYQETGQQFHGCPECKGSAYYHYE